MNLLRKAPYVCASAVLAAAVMLGAVPSHAQSSTEVSDSLIPPSATTFGKTLANDGIYLSASYIEEIMSNVAGGQTRATYFPGELTIGATLDLQKMVGLTGSSLHIIFDERNNWNIATAVGSGIGIGINPVNQEIRLTELYWEQAFDHDRLDLIFGRTNPTLFFATSNLSCAFVGALLCAQPEIWYSEINANSPFPFSEWGGRANFQITKDIYVRAGAYQDNGANGLQQGFSWTWGGSPGVFVPFEVGYQTATAKYDVGAYHDGGTQTWAWWAQGQQVVWAHGPQTLTLLAGLLQPTNGPVPFWGQYYVGAYMTAPLVSRPHDSLAIDASDVPLSKTVFPGQNSGIYSNTFAVDVGYGFSVIPGITATPWVEYMVHPSATTHPVNNAWIVGAQLYIDLGQILKFPAFVPY